MSKYLDRARELRAIVTPHYNCAQSALLPFAPEAGVSEETAYLLAANFGAGMKMASVCGAITGGLMALGLHGVDDSQTIAYYYKRLRDNHQGQVDCAPLLQINKEQGREKKPHCDDMVYECVALVEEILREKGKIG
ncbi:MAG: C_GCAxxG_C_C family protein [Clostridia bacterium]|nr:C_GCAxxG_C_C family protein [Clostridia bacterium]